MALLKSGSEPGGAIKIASGCGVGEGAGVAVAVGAGVAEGITGVAVGLEGRDRLQATNPKQQMIEHARRTMVRFSRELKQISPSGKFYNTPLFYLSRGGFVHNEVITRPPTVGAGLFIMRLSPYQAQTRPYAHGNCIPGGARNACIIVV